MSHQQSTIVLPLSQPSFRSYLLQALLAWCEDEGYTPYILVSGDDATLVPREFVTQDGTIVLCVASEATHQFEITHDSMHFQARFGEKIHTIDVPLGRISALYPKENTDLVSYFPVLETPQGAQSEKSDDKSADDLPIFTKL